MDVVFNEQCQFHKMNRIMGMVGWGTHNMNIFSSLYLKMVMVVNFVMCFYYHNKILGKRNRRKNIQVVFKDPRKTKFYLIYTHSTSVKYIKVYSPLSEILGSEVAHCIKNISIYAAKHLNPHTKELPPS